MSCLLEVCPTRHNLPRKRKVLHTHSSKRRPSSGKNRHLCRTSVCTWIFRFLQFSFLPSVSVQLRHQVAAVPLSLSFGASISILRENRSCCNMPAFLFVSASSALRRGDHNFWNDVLGFSVDFYIGLLLQGHFSDMFESSVMHVSGK